MYSLIRIIHNPSQEVLYETESLCYIPRIGERIMVAKGVYEVIQVQHIVADGELGTEQEINVLVN